MKKTGYVIFDMDGVLIDSKESILETNRAVLKHFGVSVDEETLGKVVGPPLNQVYSEYFGFKQELIPEALKLYRQIYDMQYTETVKVFCGVETMLGELLKAGYELFVATSRETDICKKMLRRLHLDCYFTEMAGLEKERNSKETVIQYILEKLPFQDRCKTVMIGDRELDVNAATANGIRTIGALYGYGSPAELRNATMLVNNTEDIIDCLQKIKL